MKGRKNRLFLPGWLGLFLLVLFLTGGATEAATLKQPVLKRVKTVGSSIAISWKPVAKATEYWIYRKGGGQVRFEKIGEYTETRMLYLDETVDPGITYTYTVQAVQRVNKRIYKSNKDNKGLSITAAIPSVELEKCTADSGKATITWKSAGKVTAYQIYRKKGSNSFHRLQTVKPDTISYTDSGLEAGSQYTYTVRAVVNDGTKTRAGNYDTKGLSVQIPGPSTELTKVDVQDGAVALVWKKVKNVGGYLVYRKAGNSTSWRKIAKITETGRNSWYDSTGTPGASYDYAVCTYINVGNNRVLGPLAKTEEKIDFTPQTPVLASVEKEGVYDALTWNTVSGITGYEIYRRIVGENSDWALVRRVSAAVSSAKLFRITDDKPVEYMIRAYVQSGQNEIKTARISPMTNEPRPASDERILFVGDSIVWGSVGNRVKAPVTFVKRVSHITGAYCYGSGVIGSLMTRQTSTDRSVASRFQSNRFHIEKFTTICIAAGTNDYARSISRGNIQDGTDKTFYGALNTIFREIKKKNPTAKVVLITPIYRCRFGSDWSIRGFSAKNTAGYTLNNYASAIKRIAAKRGAWVYDSSRMGVINENNAEVLLADGLHPGAEGHLDIGESIAEFLIEKVFQ